MLVGQIVGGTFTGGPGNASVEVAFLPEAARLALSLRPATTWASELSATRLGQATVFGVLSARELSESFVPHLRDSLNAIIAAGCDASRGCACEDELARELVEALGVVGCALTTDALLAGPLGPDLAPNLDIFDEDGVYAPGVDGVDESWSLGFGVAGVEAVFRAPVNPDCPGVPR